MDLIEEERWTVNAAHSLLGAVEEVVKIADEGQKHGEWARNDGFISCYLSCTPMQYGSFQVCSARHLVGRAGLGALRARACAITYCQTVGGSPGEEFRWSVRQRAFSDFLQHTPGCTPRLHDSTTQRLGWAAESAETPEMHRLIDGGRAGLG